jgi:hypothetical protein
MNADRSSPEIRSGDRMSKIDGGIPCTEKMPLHNPDSNDVDPIAVNFTPMSLIQNQSMDLLIYERENKPCFSLEISHIHFINYSLHIVDLFHISCHDFSIVITSLETFAVVRHYSMNNYHTIWQ